MDPRSLSSALRRIASAIDNSENPSRELVSRDLRNIVARLAGTREQEMVSAINSLVHDMTLGTLPRSATNLKFYLGRAEDIWGKNTQGWDVVEEYVTSKFGPVGAVSRDLESDHAWKIRETKAVNNWRKLMNEVEGSTFWTPSQEPSFDITQLKREILTDAYYMVSEGLPKGLEVTKEFLRKFGDFGKSKYYSHLDPEAVLKSANLGYSFPDDHEIRKQRSNITKDIATLMNESMKDSLSDDYSF
jgi:hypothetical protein